MNLKNLIKTYQDFPKNGIQFKDVTPILADPEAYDEFVKECFLWIHTHKIQVDTIVGIESRGFWFACPLAIFLKVGFIPIRKIGKLPGKTIQQSYELEYGTDSLEIQDNLIDKYDNVLIVDDILASGGTALASIKLVEKLSRNISGLLFVGEIESLNGRDKLEDYIVHSLVKL